MQDRNINYMNTKIFAPYYLLVAQSETSQQINLIYYRHKDEPYGDCCKWMLIISVSLRDFCLFFGRTCLSAAGIASTLDEVEVEVVE